MSIMGFQIISSFCLDAKKMVMEREKLQDMLNYI